MTDHITDLLNAAKLVADRENKQLLSYLISMAIVEAHGVAAPREKKSQAA